MWGLDTAALTLWLRGHDGLASRVAQTPPTPLAVTMITVDEGRGGWYTQVRRAREETHIARAYQALHEAITFLRGVQVLPCALAALRRSHALRRQHRRLGTNDLRIAASVLEQHAILVTRNPQDGVAIAGLHVEEWSSDHALYPRGPAMGSRRSPALNGPAPPDTGPIADTASPHGPLR